MRTITATAIERALTMYTPEPNSGCWLWEGTCNEDGYGRCGQAFGAHRVVYEALVGKIPDGLQLDHKCRVRSCVNPDHLEPVTNRENVLRGVAPTAVNHNKSHCIHGHPFDAENTIYRHRDGHTHRTCRACQDAKAAVSNAKRNAVLTKYQRDMLDWLGTVSFATNTNDQRVINALMRKGLAGYEHGVYRITEAGRAVLNREPANEQ